METANDSMRAVAVLTVDVDEKISITQKSQKVTQIQIWPRVYIMYNRFKNRVLLVYWRNQILKIDGTMQSKDNC